MPIDTITSSIELAGTTVVACIVCAPSGAVQALIYNVASTIKSTLDTITAIGTLHELTVRLGVLGKGGTAKNG